MPTWMHVRRHTHAQPSTEAVPAEAPAAQASPGADAAAANTQDTQALPRRKRRWPRRHRAAAPAEGAAGPQAGGSQEAQPTRAGGAAEPARARGLHLQLPDFLPKRRAASYAAAEAGSTPSSPQLGQALLPAPVTLQPPQQRLVVHTPPFVVRPHTAVTDKVQQLFANGQTDLDTLLEQGGRTAKPKALLRAYVRRRCALRGAEALYGPWDALRQHGVDGPLRRGVNVGGAQIGRALQLGVAQPLGWVGQAAAGQRFGNAVGHGTAQAIAIPLHVGLEALSLALCSAALLSAGVGALGGAGTGVVLGSLLIGLLPLPLAKAWLRGRSLEISAQRHADRASAWLHALFGQATPPHAAHARPELLALSGELPPGSLAATPPVLAKAPVPPLDVEAEARSYDALLVATTPAQPDEGAAATGPAPTPAVAAPAPNERVDAVQQALSEAQASLPPLLAGLLGTPEENSVVEADAAWQASLREARRRSKWLTIQQGRLARERSASFGPQSPAAARVDDRGEPA